MARGKHSSAATHRRMTEAEQRVRELERQLRAEVRAHGVTKRIAARAEGLETQVHDLRSQLALATCDEIADLQRALEEEREKADADRLYLYRQIVSVEEHGGMTIEDGLRIREVLGFEAWAAEQGARNREARRAHAHNPTAFNRKLFDGTIDDLAQQARHKFGITR